MLQASDRTAGIEAIQNGVLRSRFLEWPQFGYGLTAIRDHQRSTLTNALEVPAEPGLQFARADGGVPCHVVMMTTSGVLVNSRASPDVTGAWNQRAPEMGAGGYVWARTRSVSEKCEHAPS